MIVGIVIPTFNAGSQIIDCLRPIVASSLVNRLLIIDSSSKDSTAKIGKSLGAEVKLILKSDFNHGRTRQMAAELLADCDVFIFLTQDAILVDKDAIRNVLEVFSHPKVGMAYGRQLPHRDANPVAAHARYFNYPEQSEVRTIQDRHRLGLKVAFTSNSFAAYRRDALFGVGGFPSDSIVSEDMIVAAKMLLAGWKVAYVAEAMVHHSHNYTISQEFRRYFDIGVLHARESWLLETFGKPEGEGKRFVISELCYLSGDAWQLIPVSIIRTFVKYIGYRLGRAERFFSSSFKRHISMQAMYWDD